MILAAGLTPAWQQIIELDTLDLGQVNRARTVYWCASGKVVNVALALRHLQAASRLISLCGGMIGDALQQDMRDLDVDCLWIPCDAATRVCTTLLAGPDRQTTEVVENAGLASPAVIANFRAAYQEEMRTCEAVVLTGSLPRGTPVTFYAELIEQTQVPVVLDARGPELLAALPARPLVVKPNRQELAATLGRELLTEPQLMAAMRELQRRGAQWVLVTQGSGTVWLRGPNQLYRLDPPLLDTVNPIGCGDCLAAGLAWALRSGYSVPEATRLALGAAADNVRQILPARLDPQRVRQFAAQVVLRRQA